MEPFRDIRGFLAAVRARLLAVELGHSGVLAAAGLVVVTLLAPLVGALVGDRHGLELRVALGLAVVAVVGAAVIAGVMVPRRKLQDDRAVARRVGRVAPGVASDLLSVVELEPELAGDPRFSRDLALALADSTAARLRGVHVATLFPRTGVRRAARWLAAAAVVHLGVWLAAAGTLGRGWRNVLASQDDSALGGAVAAYEPIVGDIKLTFTYPRYTKRPGVTVPASSGDILAPRGTQVEIETTALRPAAAARLIFDGKPPSAARPLDIDGRTLRVSLKVEEPAAFRFLLVTPAGQSIAEAWPHRVEVEADRAPQVELFVPSEELEVSSRRRVELAWSVEDDYGVASVALVWRTPGGREERKDLPAPRDQARLGNGRLLWDLSEVPLEPGARVAYRIEATDTDDVGGPNTGSSRTFYLRVFSPLERHQQVVARLAAVLEQAITLLGDRLEQAPDSLDAYRTAHASARALVAEIGTLAGLVAQDTLAPKGLKPDLDAMHERLERIAGDEERSLEDLVARLGRGAAPGKSGFAPLGDVRVRHVTELERDVLALDDWLERQKLEEILAVADEIGQHRERLAALLKDFQRTRSEQARAQIEREMRALEQRLAELNRKMASLRGETEDRFVNADALEDRDPRDCLARVRELFEAGDAQAAARELERCGEALDRQAEALEEGLRGLRAEKFSDEERAYAEILDEVSDLARDQQGIVDESQRLADDYADRLADATRESAAPARERAKKALEAARRELGGVPREGLTPFGEEEHDTLMRRLDDVGRMLEQGDVAEALGMARQAQQGQRTLAAELEDDLTDGEPWSERTEEAADRVAKAGPLLDQLTAELEATTPTPDQLLGPVERRALDELRRRQQSIRERTNRLSGKVQKRARELPGKAAESAQQSLDGAVARMSRSEKRLGAGDPVGGREEARGAAEQLESLRKGMQRAARPSTVGDGRGSDDEPVRIPGADDYRPPEEFREDILEAMKKGRPPEGYRDLVKRYYEELVK